MTEPNQKSSRSKSGTPKTPRRQNRKPHELAVEGLMRMPLGELARTADHLVASDEETARFFLAKLRQRIQEIDETPVDQPRGEGVPPPPATS